MPPSYQNNISNKFTPFVSVEDNNIQDSKIYLTDVDIKAGSYVQINGNRIQPYYPFERDNDIKKLLLNGIFGTASAEALVNKLQQMNIFDYTVNQINQIKLHLENIGHIMSRDQKTQRDLLIESKISYLNRFDELINKSKIVFLDKANYELMKRATPVELVIKPDGLYILKLDSHSIPVYVNELYEIHPLFFHGWTFCKYSHNDTVLSLAKDNDSTGFCALEMYYPTDIQKNHIKSVLNKSEYLIKIHLFE